MQHNVLLEQQTMDSVTQIQTPLLKMHGEKSNGIEGAGLCWPHSQSYY